MSDETRLHISFWSLMVAIVGGAFGLGVIFTQLNNLDSGIREIKVDMREVKVELRDFIIEIRAFSKDTDRRLTKLETK